MNSPSYRVPSDKNIYPVTMQREKLLKKGNPYAAELYLNHCIYHFWILLHIECHLTRRTFLFWMQREKLCKKEILMLPNCTLTIEFIIFEFSFISRAIYQEFLSYFEWKDIFCTKRECLCCPIVPYPLNLSSLNSPSYRVPFEEKVFPILIAKR